MVGPQAAGTCVLTRGQRGTWCKGGSRAWGDTAASSGQCQPQRLRAGSPLGPWGCQPSPPGSRPCGSPPPRSPPPWITSTSGHLRLDHLHPGSPPPLVTSAPGHLRLDHLHLWSPPPWVTSTLGHLRPGSPLLQKRFPLWKPRPWKVAHACQMLPCCRHLTGSFTPPSGEGADGSPCTMAH